MTLKAFLFCVLAFIAGGVKVRAVETFGFFFRSEFNSGQLVLALDSDTLMHLSSLDSANFLYENYAKLLVDSSMFYYSMYTNEKFTSKALVVKNLSQCKFTESYVMLYLRYNDAVIYERIEVADFKWCVIWYDEEAKQLKYNLCKTYYSE
jgi:hypothetical protein